MKKPLLLAALLALAVSSVACAGLTPTERSVASGVVYGVATATDPVCVLAGGGTACGPVSQDVSDVAKLIGDIVAALPSAMRAAAAGPVVKAFTYRGVMLTLPASIADAVRTKLPAAS